MRNDALNLKKRRSWLLAALVALQTLALAGIALSYYAVGWYGQDIRLRTVPVDPRDLLYGDYVTLAYDISTVTPAMWKGSDRQVKRGDVIYVVVKPGTDGVYVPVAASDTKPSVSAGEVTLKARAMYAWDRKHEGGVRVSYGIEKYYVPENTGKALEEKAAQLIVHVKVAPWGQPKIEGLEDAKG